MTPREMEVMQIFWNSSEPLMASQVAAIKGFSLSTVNSVVKKLLQKGYISVTDIVHSGTVLTRRYQPTISFQEYTITTFMEQLKSANQRIPIPQVVASLIREDGNQEKVILELEQMLADYKRLLKGNQ